MYKSDEETKQIEAEERWNKHIDAFLAEPNPSLWKRKNVHTRFFVMEIPPVLRNH